KEHVEMGNNEVRKTFDAWLEAWQTLDVDKMKGLFLQDFHNLIYLAEEHEGNPLNSWEEINEYWEAKRGRAEVIQEWKELWSTQTDLNDEFSIVTTRLNVILKYAKPWEGTIHCSIVMKKTDKGYRICHFHESRPIDFAEIKRKLAEGTL